MSGRRLMNDFPTYRDDDLNKKDTGHIVKRYVLALKQLQLPEPADLPFKDCLILIQNDTTVDPFDAIEMIGVVGETKPQTTAPAPGPLKGPKVLETKPAE